MDYHNLFNPGWTYGMSFLASGKERKTPALACTTSLAHAQMLCEKLADEGILDRLTDRTAYFDAKVPFAVSANGFGFRGCGCRTETEEGIRYEFPLTRDHTKEIALSVHVLMGVCNYLLALAKDEKAPRANRVQLMEVEPFVRPKETMYGHPISGEISAAFRRALAKYGSSDRTTSDGWFNPGKPLPKRITNAMRQAWCALTTPEVRKYSKACIGYVSEDGRFILQCPGNACDVAIYPDGAPGLDRDTPSRFGCHNLDGATQQLTLLAGLAALHDWGRTLLESESR